MEENPFRIVRFSRISAGPRHQVEKAESTAEKRREAEELRELPQKGVVRCGPDLLLKAERGFEERALLGRLALGIEVVTLGRLLFKKGRLVELQMEE